MNRTEKIELLKALEAGLCSIEKLKDNSDNGSAVVIYGQGPVYRITGSQKLLTQQQLDLRLKGKKTVLFMPDNGRDS